jgi:hypothetical protein
MLSTGLARLLLHTCGSFALTVVRLLCFYASLDPQLLLACGICFYPRGETGSAGAGVFNL